MKERPVVNKYSSVNLLQICCWVCRDGSLLCQWQCFVPHSGRTERPWVCRCYSGKFTSYKKSRLWLRLSNSHLFARDMFFHWSLKPSYNLTILLLLTFWNQCVQRAHTHVHWATLSSRLFCPSINRMRLFHMIPIVHNVLGIGFKKRKIILECGRHVPTSPRVAA